MSSLTLLSNINISSLASRFSASSGLSVYTPAGYNTWVQELTNPNSTLNTREEGIVFLLLDGSELLGEKGLVSLETAKEILAPYMDLIESFSKAHPYFHFFTSTLDIPPRRLLPILSARTERPAAAFWREQLELRGLPALDMEELAAQIGRATFYSPRMWLLGNIPFSQTAELLLQKEMNHLIHAACIPRKKCLLLDLDNTLWGGVIGENGLEGISLATHKNGSEYREFQQRIRELKDQGVLLAVVSKNNLEDALLPFREHPDMVLKEEDISVFCANWNPKEQNIRHIAEELNLGLNSFVFIDDNPLERESVSIALPEVTVPSFPNESSQLPAFIDHIAKEYFLTLHLTDEDRKKTEQYRIDRERKTAQSQFSTVEDYLDSLEMILTVHPVFEQDIPRASQLTQKTNQFNLTTRRYTEPDLFQRIQSDEWALWIGSLNDSFGSHGQIIMAIVQLSGSIARMDTFLMSCRVMGRGVESAFLQVVESHLYARGIRKIRGEYIPTPKNNLVASFWESNGYTPTKTPDNAPGSVLSYTLQAPFPLREHHIRVTEPDSGNKSSVE